MRNSSYATLGDVNSLSRADNPVKRFTWPPRFEYSTEMPFNVELKNSSEITVKHLIR
jgi:hypothetical protein